MKIKFVNGKPTFIYDDEATASVVAPLPATAPLSNGSPYPDLEQWEAKWHSVPKVEEVLPVFQRDAITIDPFMSRAIWSCLINLPVHIFRQNHIESRTLIVSVSFEEGPGFCLARMSPKPDSFYFIRHNQTFEGTVWGAAHEECHVFRGDVYTTETPQDVIDTTEALVNREVAAWGFGEWR